MRRRSPFARKRKEKQAFLLLFSHLIVNLTFVEDTLARKKKRKNSFSFAFLSLNRIFAVKL